MKKKKIIGITAGSIVILAIVIYTLVYLLGYKFNDAEVVVFNDKVKVNIDKDLAIYDANKGEIIGKAHVVYQADDCDGKFNISGEVLPTRNITLKKGENNVSVKHKNGTNVCISNPYCIVDEDGNLKPEIDDYHFWLYIDKEDNSKYMIRILKYGDDCEYILVDATDKTEAEDIISSIDVYE